MKAISFIVPVYNASKTLEKSVLSILNGNLTEQDEIILVNDASSDKSLDICYALKSRNPDNIKVISHNINKGSAAASRNTGIDASKNDFIFCLDADNYLIPESIAELVGFLIENDADAAAFGEIHYLDVGNGEIAFKWLMNQEVSILDNINHTQKTPCSSGNYLFTKDSWKKAGRYNESIGGAFDSWAFGMMQLITGAKMMCMPNSHYLHSFNYESTYVRENKKVTASLRMSQVLLPYISLFHPKDVEYMLSAENRLTWFDEIQNRKIRLKEGKKESVGFLKSFKKKLTI